MQKNIKKTGGFSLAETLVVVGISTMLMLSVTLLFKDIFVDSRQGNAALGASDQGRLMAANFINEVRNANYGADGSFALAEAGDSEMIIFTNYHTGSTINRIRYYVSGTSLYKGVIVPTGTPPTYNAANEKVTPVVTNITNGLVTPAFYYYDGNYNGVSGSPLAQTVNVNSVKFVKLNLLILKQDTAGSTATFTVDDGAALRNLKTNLGN